MNLGEIILESLQTLKVNKLRTGLAVLGIVIGIGSVITLISLGTGSQKAVESQIQSLGSNLLTVRPGFVTSGRIRGAAGGGTTLTLADAEAIASSPKVTNVSRFPGGGKKKPSDNREGKYEYPSLRSNSDLLRSPQGRNTSRIFYHPKGYGFDDQGGCFGTAGSQ